MEQKATSTLFIGNLPLDTQQQELSSIFLPYGAISSRINPNKPFGFVTFSSHDAASNVFQNSRNAFQIRGQTLRISWAKEDPKQIPSTFNNPLFQQQPQQQILPFQQPSEEQKNIIDRLVEHVSKNGPEFENIMLERMKDDPKFTFLQSGTPYHSYYKWMLQIKLSQLQQPLQQPQQPALIPPQNISQLDFEEEKQFKDLLSKLSKTRESIQAVSNWIAEHGNNNGSSNSADEKSKIIARYISEALFDANPVQKKLYILYAINEALCITVKKRADIHKPDALAQALEPLLGGCFSAISRSLPDDREHLKKVLLIWEKREIYPISFINRWSCLLPPSKNDPSDDFNDETTSKSTAAAAAHISTNPNINIFSQTTTSSQPPAPGLSLKLSNDSYLMEQVPQKPVSLPPPGVLVSQLNEVGKAPIPYTPINSSALPNPKIIPTAEIKDASVHAAVDGFYRGMEEDKEKAKEKEAKKKKRSRSRSRSTSRSRSSKNQKTTTPPSTSTKHHHHYESKKSKTQSRSRSPSPQKEEHHHSYHRKEETSKEQSKEKQYHRHSKEHGKEESQDHNSEHHHHHSDHK